MKDNFLRIEPIKNPFGGAEEANALAWAAQGYQRGDESQTIQVAVLHLNEGADGTVNSTYPITNYNLVIPKDVIEKWGPDSVIDDFILASNENYKKRELGGNPA